jgi:hypothetical protein
MIKKNCEIHISEDKNLLQLAHVLSNKDSSDALLPKGWEFQTKYDIEEHNNNYHQLQACQVSQNFCKTLAPSLHR